MRLLRCLICAVLVIPLAPRAFAGDYDFLRGDEPVSAPTYTNWTGFYLGGQFGYNDINAEFANTTQGPLAYVLRNSTLEATSDPSAMSFLGTANHGATTYGAFVGYNTQWEDLILGLEANLNHTSAALNAPDSPIVRSGFTDGDGNSYTIGVSGSGTVKNLDYGTLRARAGWILGSFLPYGFAGFALGVADVNIAATMVGTCESGSTATCSPFAFTANAGTDNKLLYGFTVGGGIDIALTQNIFVRGEYEYIRFAPVFNVPIAISSARVGAGIKF